MKKILSLITVLFIILTILGAHAENTTIGGGLTSPSQGTPSTGIGGVGGSLTPPGGSLAPVQRSADNGKGNRPSPEWLSAIDAPIIADLLAMSTDPYMMKLWEMPERAYAHLNPAAEYNPVPSVIIYGSDRVPLLLTAVSGKIDSNIYSGLLMGSIQSVMTSEEIVLSAAINITDYHPTDTEYVYTAAIYTSSSEPESNPVLVSHTCEDGISTITARYITSSSLSNLTDKDSDFSLVANTMGLKLYYSEDKFPEFNASTGLNAVADIAVADDEWLTGVAFEMAEQIIDMASDSDLVSLYTISPDVIDICREFSEFDIANAEVVSIEPFEYENLLTYIAGINDSECPELIAKYFGPKFSSMMRINNVRNSSTNVVAAATICHTTANYFAEGDFTSCNVTLSCGGKYNIVVSFGNYGNGIITADAMFVPAE